MFTIVSLFFSPILSIIGDHPCSFSLFLQLTHAKSRTRYIETRDTISKINRLTIQTGLLTTILAILVVTVELSVRVGAMFTLPYVSTSTVSLPFRVHHSDFVHRMYVLGKS